VKCHQPRCSDPVMLTCKTCNFGFCSTHRFPEDHECVKIEPEKTFFDQTLDLGKQLGLIHKENKVKSIHFLSIL
jgi:hypothetical protein